MPIKFVDKHLFNLQNKVLLDDGISSRVLAVPQNIGKNKRAFRLWRVLLDSGSDGDLLFVHKSSKNCIPFKERFAPQKWHTSNGAFQTTKVGRLDVTFPEFSKSKVAHIRPDIVEIPAELGKPVYDLIIGVETMAKMGIVLDFANKEITIDQIKHQMKALIDHKDSKALHNFSREITEPASTAAET